METTEERISSSEQPFDSISAALEAFQGAEQCIRNIKEIILKINAEGTNQNQEDALNTEVK